jgi:protocatechuate 3,4-dioxygenase, alpha subunit
MPELPTPSQTVGPFFNIGMPGEPPADGPLRISGTVRDGEGAPVPDALIETWQPGSRAFHRAETDAQGRYEVVTDEPGEDFILVAVFARGLLKHLVTRIYFALDDVPPEFPRRETLVAEPAGEGAWTFDIRLQGESETVFFDV